MFDNMKKNLGVWLAVFLILVCAMPVLAGCMFAVPSADDFSNAIGWKNCDGGHLQYLFSNAIRIYLSWQGTYAGNLFVGFPIYYMGGIWGLRIVLFSCALLLFVSFFVFIWNVLVNLGISRSKQVEAVLILFSVCLFFLLGVRRLSESFFWYTGACVYTIPICCSLLSISFYLQFIRNGKMQYWIGSTILVIIAVGGALVVSAMTCAILVFISVYRLIIQHKVDKGHVIVAISIIGSLVNSIAPGNFVRAEAKNGIHVFSAIINTMIRISKSSIGFFMNGWLLLLIVIAFLIGYFFLSSNDFQFRFPALVTIYCLFAMAITDFPVMLGYGSGGISQRCEFVETMVIILGFAFSSLYWGGWATKKRLFDFSNTSLLIVALVCFCMFAENLSWDNFWIINPNNMARHIINGDFSNISQKEMNMLDQIIESDDEYVVVQYVKDQEDEWTNIKRIGLSEDEEYWVNVAVAEYYGKSAITLEYIE